ncbi:hypothetical protein Tco_0708673, partial [Tanacetum coccineum]
VCVFCYGYPAGTGYNNGGYASAVAAAAPEYPGQNSYRPLMNKLPPIQGGFADSGNYGPSSGYPTQPNMPPAGPRGPHGGMYQEVKLTSFMDNIDDAFTTNHGVPATFLVISTADSNAVALDSLKLHLMARTANANSAATVASEPKVQNLGKTNQERRVPRLQEVDSTLIRKIKRHQGYAGNGRVSVVTYVLFQNRNDAWITRIVGDDSARSEPTEVADSNNFKPLLKEKRLKEQTNLYFEVKKRATTQRRSLGRRIPSEQLGMVGWIPLNRTGSRDRLWLRKQVNTQEGKKDFCWERRLKTVQKEDKNQNKGFWFGFRAKILKATERILERCGAKSKHNTQGKKQTSMLGTGHTRRGKVACGLGLNRYMRNKQSRIDVDKKGRERVEGREDSKIDINN